MTNSETASEKIPIGARRTAAIAFALAAACVAGYLGVVSWQMRGTPWGCGAGSGCADVLKSRWSNVAGVPVGLLAAVAYLALACVAWLGGPKGASLLTALAALVMTTVAYFVVLQLVVIQAICPWCMLDHTLGFAAAFSALLLARRLVPREAPHPIRQATDDPLAEYDASSLQPSPAGIGRRGSAMAPVITGVSLALVFVVLQHFTARTPDVARIESGGETSVSEQGDVLLTLKNGETRIPSALLPRIGPSDAPKRLILLFDYCCPHCREAHAAIRRAQPLAGETWQVLFLSTPLNADCNPAIEETEDRFRDACELARLSLAVWQVRPADWPAFDAWLFESESPRSAAEAHRHAAAVYGELEIAEAVLSSKIMELIASNVAVYQAAGTKVLPMILSPGVAGIAGRTDSPEELLDILKRDFGFPTPP